MKTKTGIWLAKPVLADYAAAYDFLSLTFSEAATGKLVQRLRKAPVVTRLAKDLLRASNTPLLERGNSHVSKDLKKVAKDKKLSPVLLVRGDDRRGVPLTGVAYAPIRADAGSAQSLEVIGRRERIRTSGPYVPNVVLYQAELLSEPVRGNTPRLGRRPYNDAPPPPQPAKKGSGVRSFWRFAGRPGWLYTGRARVCPGPAGASPSGKALDFDSSIRRFDPFRPSQSVPALQGISEWQK
jgi:hypothetical protein